jgi:hypothetical protein
MRTMREIAGWPSAKALDGFEEQERVIKSTRGGGVLSGLLLPSTYKVLYAALDGDASRGLVRVAVAAARFKAKHGKYPDAPAALVPEFLPEVPADPFDGRPVRFKPADGGVVVYSIGRDRTDDGGNPWDDKKKTGDLVFRLK